MEGGGDFCCTRPMALQWVCWLLSMVACPHSRPFSVILSLWSSCSAPPPPFRPAGLFPPAARLVISPAQFRQVASVCVCVCVCVRVCVCARSLQIVTTFFCVQSYASRQTFPKGSVRWLRTCEPIHILYTTFSGSLLSFFNCAPKTGSLLPVPDPQRVQSVACPAEQVTVLVLYRLSLCGQDHSLFFYQSGVNHQFPFACTTTYTAAAGTVPCTCTSTATVPATAAVCSIRSTIQWSKTL